MALHQGSPTESPHHQDVLPSILVEAVLNHLWFSFILNVRPKRMHVPCLQLDFASFTSSLKSSSFTHLLHLACTVIIFRKWNNINTQSMCPSSHLLIRRQCKSVSLNREGQMFEAHLYTSWTRDPTGYCLIPSTTKWGERQHFFQQLWLGHLSSPTLCLSLPLCLF